MSVERTLVLLKPDALQRNLLGEVVTRFERKGLKIIGIKMSLLTDEMLEEHYSHLADKPFFAGLKKYMKQTPVVALALEGEGCVEAVRLITGATLGAEADAGTIRGDFSMAVPGNIVHASDSKEAAEEELYRFFNEDELFEYRKVDELYLYWPE